MFEVHGSVQAVNVITEPSTGRPRGFAFVEMAEDAEAEKAIVALNGTEVGGRQLTVNEARPQRDRGDRKGGRGDGGGRGHARKPREPRW
jgi:RNA recognition motif-containing protein